jgi:hypothetical protein
MTNEYDIIQCLSDSFVRWCERVSGLIKTRRRLSLHPHVIDLFVVGHSARQYTRQEVVQWLKSRYQGVTIIALSTADQELIGADYNVLHSQILWLGLLPEAAEQANPRAAY